MKTSTKSKHLQLLSLLAASSLFLGGCVSRNQDSWTFRLIASPINQLIEWLAQFFNGNYGFAIIGLVIIIRLLLIPLTYKQQTSSILGTEKRRYYQPYLMKFQELIQGAETPEEQMEYTRQQQAFMKDNNISLFGNMGCLPLLIQLPILSGMYVAIYNNQNIANYNFFGFSLGEPTLVLTIIFILLSFLQTRISMQTMPEEVREQQGKSMLFMPLMLGFVVFNVPAAIGLYLVTTTIWGMLQQLAINTFVHPRIKAKVEDEMKDNPIRFDQHYKPNNTVKDVTHTANSSTSSTKPHKSNRNAGKQNRKK